MVKLLRRRLPLWHRSSCVSDRHSRQSVSGPARKRHHKPVAPLLALARILTPTICRAIFRSARRNPHATSPSSRSHTPSGLRFGAVTAPQPAIENARTTAPRHIVSRPLPDTAVAAPRSPDQRRNLAHSNSSQLQLLARILAGVVNISKRRLPAELLRTLQSGPTRRPAPVFRSRQRVFLAQDRDQIAVEHVLHVTRIGKMKPYLPGVSPEVLRYAFRRSAGGRRLAIDAVRWR